MPRGTVFLRTLFVFYHVFHCSVSTCWAQDIRDVQPPVNPPVNPIIFFVVLLCVIICGLVIIFYLRMRRGESKEIEKVSLKTPWEIAFESLEKLKEENLPSKGLHQLYTVRISNIVRRYMENQFQIHAPEMTTEEFFHSLKDHLVLTDAQKNSLRNFMNECDMVKFAQHTPTQEQMDQNFQLALALVNETKDSVQPEVI